MNNPATGGRILYVYGLYGEKSSYKSRIPEKELKRLDPQMLKEELSTLLENGFSSIHHVGNKNDAELSGLLSANSIFKKNNVDQYEFLEAQDIAETTFYVLNEQKSSAELCLLYSKWGALELCR